MAVYNVQVKTTAIILVTAPDEAAAKEKAERITRQALEPAGFTIEVWPETDAFESEPVPLDIVR